jgi:hypothetical protein
MAGHLLTQVKVLLFFHSSEARYSLHEPLLKGKNTVHHMVVYIEKLEAVKNILEKNL